MAAPYIGVYAKTYGPYQGSGGLITPAPPTVSYNNATRKLTATDKVSPAGKLLFSFQGSAFVEYLGAIQVDGAAHDPGEWRFKRAAAAGYAESAVANSPAIAPATAPVQPLILKSSDFRGNVYDLDGGSGSYTYRKRSSLAFVRIDPKGATQFELTVGAPLLQTPFGAAAGAIFSIYDDKGAFVDSVQAQNVSGYQTLNTAVLSASTYYDFVEGGSSQTGNASFEGSYIQAIKALNGGTISVVKPTVPSNAVRFVGDSILQGFNATNNSRYAYAVRLRTLLGAAWDVAVTGWGAAFAGGMLFDATLRQVLAQQLVDSVAGVTGRKVLVDVLGTNDYGYGPGVTDPAIAAGYKADLWDRVKALDSSIEIISATPLWRSDKDSANGLGKVLADYATAFNAVASNRAYSVKKVDCLPWLVAANYNEPGGGALVHPGDGGHYTDAQRWFEAITNTQLSPYLQVGETIQEDDRRVTAPNFLRNDNPLPGSGVSFFSGAQLYTNTVGATATIATQVRQLQFHTYTDRTSGNFDLYCNGVFIGTYSLYSAAPVSNVFITSAVAAVAGNGIYIWQMRKADADDTFIYLDEILGTDGTLTPTPSLGGGSAATPVSWRDVSTNVTATTSQIELTGSKNGTLNAVARSTQAIAADKDGYVDFAIPANNSDVFGALSYGPAPVDFNGLQFAIYREGSGLVRVWERGQPVKAISQTSAPTDTYRIEVKGGTVRYYYNNVDVYASLKSPAGQLLYAAGALNDTGAKLSNVGLSSPDALVVY